MNENVLGKKLCLIASNLGARIFRVNTGMGWVGETINFSKKTTLLKLDMYPGDIIIRKARPLHAGLCEGGSDFIGWSSKIITQNMVGKKVALFTALEIKTLEGKTNKNRLEKQQAFIDAVNNAGGIASIIKDEESAFELLS